MPAGALEGDPSTSMSDPVSVRRARAVPGYDACRSPGVEGLIVAGRYQNPLLVDPLPSAVGLLMLKPGVVVDTAGVTEVAERLAECGYTVGAARVVSPDEVRSASLLRRHYQDHWAVARAGRLLPDEEVELDRRYDRPGFRARWGRRPSTLPRIGAARLADDLGIGLAPIARWAERAADAYGVDSGHELACNEVGELVDVQLLGGLDELGLDPARGPSAPVSRSVRPPLFVVNPQIGSLAAWWEDGPDPTAVFAVVPIAGRPLDWATMRGEVLGARRGGQWPVGSFRGDMASGVSALRYRPGIVMSPARNGVHLSNGPVEAMRELSVWFGVDPARTRLGVALRAAGMDPAAVLRGVYLREADAVEAASARTAHEEVDAVVGCLGKGQLLDADLRPVIVGERPG